MHMCIEKDFVPGGEHEQGGNVSASTDGNARTEQEWGQRGDEDLNRDADEETPPKSKPQEPVHFPEEDGE